MSLRIFGLFALLLIASHLLAREGLAQEQIADPTFRPNVEDPAYREYGPRVLFDEGHQNIHTVAGRYAPFVELLALDGYDVIPSRTAFRSEVLKGFDVLVIAGALGGDTPQTRSRPAFTEEEERTVVEWVYAGGSLLLVGDHMPVSGAVRGLAERFGVDMTGGVALDSLRRYPGTDNPGSLWFTRENGLLRDHPITVGRHQGERVDEVRTWTGTSLQGPEGSFPILVLSETAIDRQRGVETSAFGRAQGMALEFGRGRVLVLGEAAMLTAQVLIEPGRAPYSPHGMNSPDNDNPQFVLNAMHWLTRLIGH